MSKLVAVEESAKTCLRYPEVLQSCKIMKEVFFDLEFRRELIRYALSVKIYKSVPLSLFCNSNHTRLKK